MACFRWNARLAPTRKKEKKKKNPPSIVLRNVAQVKRHPHSPLLSPDLRSLGTRHDGAVHARLLTQFPLQVNESQVPQVKWQSDGKEQTVELGALGTPPPPPPTAPLLLS